ncbi:MAG TPA: zinc-binding dehydrogenase [Ilumatobacteraceae bacterium]|nr:zinc-binding dehydrogenase [Ilumatobacteraceae bacterium]
MGSAAVQLAVAAGARVIATAGSANKLDLARRLGAEVAIDYRRQDLVSAVAEATNGQGVDVCFDGVGGEVMVQSLRCLARNGRHLVIGFASGIEAEEVPMITGRQLCFGNISVLGVILTYGDPAAVPLGSGFNPVPRTVGDQVQAELVELLRSGSIRPLIGEVIDFADVPRRLEAMEDRTTTGRVVVKIR